MATTTETLLLQVDIQANTARLAEIQKGLNENAAALKTLNQSFAQNKISADELAAGQVRLRQEAANLKTEQSALTKANTDQIRVLQAEAGSIEQLRAQLSLGTAAYNAMSKAERENSEEGQKLQASNKSLSDNLKVLESAIGDTRRNVGNYGAAIEPLLTQLVKLEEQQKAAVPDSKEYQEVTRQIGFVQKAAQDAGAQMGLSADQANAKLAKTAEAIRPATAELVKLEAEQAKVEKGSEAYSQIGFKINKAKQEIAKVPAELQHVEQATAGVKKGFDTVISKALGPFQGEIDKATGLVGKFKTGNDLLSRGLSLLKGAGETGSLGFKALASGIALTGIGLFVIAISAVVAYFTQTAEGGKILKGVLAGLGATFQVVLDLVTGLGKAIVFAFTHPLEALENFGKAVTQVLLHPLDSAKQLGNAVGDVGSKALKAAKDAYALIESQKALVKARRELEIEDVKERGRVEVLIRLSKDRTLSAQDRLNKLKEAGRIEEDITSKNLALQEKELANIRTEIELKGKSKDIGDLKQAEADKRKEIEQTRVTQETTLATIQARQSRFILEQRAEAAKAAADAATARQKAIEDEIKERITQTERELLNVRQGSQEELALREQLITQKAELEQAADKKTAADRKLIVSRTYTELLKLEDEYFAKREAAAIAAQQKGDAERIAALNAEKKRQEEDAKDKNDAYQRDLAMMARYIDRRRTEVENDYAEGKSDKKAYDKAIELLDETSYGARIALGKAYNKDVSALEAQQAATHRKNLVGQREAEQKLNQERIELAQAFGLELGQIISSTVLDAGATLEDFAGRFLILLLDTLQKQILAGEVSVLVNALAKQGPLGLVEAALLTATIEGAFSVVKGVIAQKPKFATGGIVPGGSYEGDKVPVLANSGEFILRREVGQLHPEMPFLLSHLNALAGGVNFAPGYISSTQVRGQIDGGLMARQLGSAKAPTAAEIGREVGKNVPKSIGVHTIREAEERFDRPRNFASTKSWDKHKP